MQHNGELTELYRSIAPNLRGQALILRKLLTETGFFSSNKVMHSYHQQFIDKLVGKFGDDASIDMELFLKENTPNLDSFIKECGHGLVNMMLHWLYSSDICMQTGEQLLEKYAGFVIKYILIRFYLMALAEPGNGAELLVGITHSFSRSSRSRAGLPESALPDPEGQ